MAFLILCVSITTLITLFPFTNASTISLHESTQGWEIQECNVTENIYGLSFIDANTGWVVGGSWDTFYGFFRYTTNGGETWNSPYNTSLPDQPSEPIPILFDVSFYNVEKGMAVGWDGRIYYTTDGGINWDSIQPYWLNTYYGAHMIDEDWGYAVGVYPMFYQCLVTRTTDCWQTYHDFYFPLYVPGEGFFDISKVSDVYFLDHYHGYATVDAGYYQGAIIYTFNGGFNWETVYWNESASPNGIDFPSPEVGYAVGNFGLVLKTRDGGITWEEIDSGISADLVDVSFPTELVGIAIGKNGLIIRTNNGGKSWNIQESGVNTDLHAVDFVDGNNGWIVGDEGLILHTDTGGYEIAPSLFSQ